jgi:hypothetical protein
MSLVALFYYFKSDSPAEEKSVTHTPRATSGSQALPHRIPDRNERSRKLKLQHVILCLRFRHVLAE